MKTRFAWAAISKTIGHDNKAREKMLEAWNGEGPRDGVHGDDKTGSFLLCRKPLNEKPSRSYCPRVKTANMMHQMHAPDPKTEQEIRAFIRATKRGF